MWRAAVGIVPTCVLLLAAAAPSGTVRGGVYSPGERGCRGRQPGGGGTSLPGRRGADRRPRPRGVQPRPPSSFSGPEGQARVVFRSREALLLGTQRCGVSAGRAAKGVVQSRHVSLATTRCHHGGVSFGHRLPRTLSRLEGGGCALAGRAVYNLKLAKLLWNEARKKDDDSPNRDLPPEDPREQQPEGRRASTTSPAIPRWVRATPATETPKVVSMPATIAGMRAPRQRPDPRAGPANRSDSAPRGSSRHPLPHSRRDAKQTPPDRRALHAGTSRSCI